MATYAFSDLHGNYNLWYQIKNFLKKDDKAYCLGDCCDRQPDGIKIIQEILNDNRIIYLKGNHEDMILNYISLIPWDNYDKQIIKYNEMQKTIWDFRALSKEDFNELKEKISHLPLSTIYINKDNKKIFLSHAGCDPWNIETRTERDLLWDRDHLKTKETDIRFNNNDIIIVHGHTPVQILKQEKVYKYCGNRKIDIDMGSFISNKIALLNLDTFETTYFFDNK